VDRFPVPTRARTWCQTTFTCQKSYRCESLDAVNSIALGQGAVPSPDSANRALSRHAAVPGAIRSSRAAILALHELLI
jgi:hypothetical protein